MADWAAAAAISAADDAALAASLGGSGTVVTYLMRAWGTVSLDYVYWSGSAPDPTGAGAGEVVNDVVLVSERSSA